MLSTEKECERRLDDGEGELFANEPLDDDEGPENEIHDGPEYGTMDVITYHRRTHSNYEVYQISESTFGTKPNVYSVGFDVEHKTMVLIPLHAPIRF